VLWLIKPGIGRSFERIREEEMETWAIRDECRWHGNGRDSRMKRSYDCFGLKSCVPLLIP
jgi:hypothetical protein